jgi:hypothetical protein
VEGDRELGPAGGTPPVSVRFSPRRLPPLLVILCIFPLGAGASGDLAVQVRTLYERGEYAASARLAETAPEPSPDLVLYHGLALARLEKLDQARDVFQAGRGRYPGDKRFALELAGVAYRNKRLSEAKSFLREALRLDPADGYGNEFLGWVYLLDGNTAATLRYWNRIDKPLLQEVRLDPVPDLHPILRERAIELSGGQVFTRARLRATEANLERLGILRHRQMELTPRQDQRFDLTLRSAPASSSLSGWPGQVLPLARGLPYRAVHFDRFNIAGRAIHFQSLWRWDPEKRRIGMELAGPIGLHPRRGYRLSLDARDENWDLSRTYLADTRLHDLKARKIEAGAGLIFALGDRLNWTTGLRLARRGFQNDDGSALFAGAWSFEQRNQFDYLLLDSPDPRLRIESAAILRTGRVFASGRSRFAMAEGDLSSAWTPGSRGETWEVLIRLRAGKTLGRSPFDQLFQLGMERDNDLWLRGHVGTERGRKGSAPLGSDYALVQAGFDRTLAQLPLVRLKAGPFLDLGWIGEPSGRLGSQGWLPDAGIQAKVVVAGGVTWSVTYGRDLRGGGGVLYTAVFR